MTEDDAKDAPGFTGELARAPIELKQMNSSQFISFFVVYPAKLSEMMTIIRQIDKDRNGYITQTELDDIIKLIFAKNHLLNSEQHLELISPI